MGGDKTISKKKDSRMSPFLPFCVPHLKGFSLRLVEARNDLRSLCRITTQYFITHNLIIYFFSSTIIDYFLTCIIICITQTQISKHLSIIGVIKCHFQV